MATVINENRRNNDTSYRTITQKVCIGLGILFVAAGLLGIIMPGFMGFHLSMAHNVVHLLSGSLAIWAGYHDDIRKSYYFCIGFGVVYGFLGLAGFIWGRPGFPGVGHMEADNNLLRIIPNVLELGTSDHGLHIFLSAIFIVSAVVWKRREAQLGITSRPRTTVSETLNRDAAELENSESDLRDASLGRSDINRRSDIERRTDFERRL